MSQIESNQDLTGEMLTGMFSHAFSQPLKLLGYAESSLSGFAVFWSVASKEGRTQVEISGSTGLSAKTVSRVISQLGETRSGRGWIRQIADENDRRVRRLHLSKKGKAVHTRMIDDITRQWDDI
jgi:DNA-binding MarR family transcriptional regulator